MPARLVAAALGHGDRAIVSAERALGGPYLWASEFENVHATWVGFSEPGFSLGGRRWAGAEQLFQAHKLGDAGDAIFEARADEFARASEAEAYALGRRVALRRDWETARGDDVGVRDRAMTRALRGKFSAAEPAARELRSLLASTHPHALCSVKADAYWGIGFDGRGRNRLAELLVELREGHRAEHRAEEGAGGNGRGLGSRRWPAGPSPVTSAHRRMLHPREVCYESSVVS